MTPPSPTDPNQALPPGPWYIAVLPFGPQAGDRWHDYVAWSGLSQVAELVTLDVVLCPSVITELTSEDWAHNVQADCLLDLFLDLDYLLQRVSRLGRCDVLAVEREPAAESARVELPGFLFQGYDLVETPGLGVSALTNCGGFPLAFAPGELNSAGLLPSFERARAVQSALRRHYPDEPHADTNVWAVWRRAAGHDSGPP